MADTNTQKAESSVEELEKDVQIKRIFIKDLSFENPNLPLLAAKQDKEPVISVSISSAGKLLFDDHHEVVLTVVVKAKIDDKVVYMTEIQQAGIFQISGYSEKQVRRIKGVYCAGILFPYARAAITDLVARGSLPQLIVRPVNFEELFRQMEQTTEVAEDRRLSKQYEIYLRSSA